MYRRFRSQKAFTLIELLVVTSIIAVVAGVIGACLAGGIRAWDAARDFTVVEADALIDIEIMQRDLMNAVRFRGIGFRGSKTRMSFPALLDGEELDASMASDEGDSPVPRIGTISYVFDSEKSMLLKKTWIYPLEESAAGNGRKMISNLRDVNLQFYQSAMEGEDQGVWVPSWDNTTNHPVRVKIGLIFADGLQPKIITRTIILPMGGGG